MRLIGASRRVAILAVTFSAADPLREVGRRPAFFSASDRAGQEQENDTVWNDTSRTDRAANRGPRSRGRADRARAARSPSPCASTSITPTASISALCERVTGQLRELARRLFARGLLAGPRPAADEARALTSASSATASGSGPARRSSGRRNFTGRLDAADEKRSALELDGEPAEIPLERVHRSNLVP